MNRWLSVFLLGLMVGCNHEGEEPAVDEFGSVLSARVHYESDWTFELLAADPLREVTVWLINDYRGEPHPMNRIAGDETPTQDEWSLFLIGDQNWERHDPATNTTFDSEHVWALTYIFESFDSDLVRTDCVAFGFDAQGFVDDGDSWGVSVPSAHSDCRLDGNTEIVDDD